MNRSNSIQRGDTMSKIVHVQTVMTEEELENLKTKTKESTTKEAIRTAIEYYMGQ